MFKKQNPVFYNGVLFKFNFYFILVVSATCIPHAVCALRYTAVTERPSAIIAAILDCSLGGMCAHAHTLIASCWVSQMLHPKQTGHSVRNSLGRIQLRVVIIVCLIIRCVATIVVIAFSAE